MKNIYERIGEAILNSTGTSTLILVCDSTEIELVKRKFNTIGTTNLNGIVYTVFDLQDGVSNTDSDDLSEMYRILPVSPSTQPNITPNHNHWHSPNNPWNDPWNDWNRMNPLTTPVTHPFWDKFGTWSSTTDYDVTYKVKK